MQCKDCPADCGMKYLPGMLGCGGLIKWMEQDVQQNFYRRKQLLDERLQLEMRLMQVDTVYVIPPELLQDIYRQKQSRFYKPPHPLRLTRRALQEMVSCGALG